MNQKKIRAELLRLMQKHPDLPIIPAILDECVDDKAMYYGAHLASVFNIKVDYFLFDRETQYWFAGKEGVMKYIYHVVGSQYYNEPKKISDPLFYQNMVKKEFKKLQKAGIVKKGIILYISLFDPEEK